uniref:Uncharacterized protein n=1 Tax=Anguilla anguilla TaxID=7936 RepID=A0A0E9WS15_ANGAN
MIMAQLPTVYQISHLERKSVLHEFKECCFLIHIH